MRAIQLVCYYTRTPAPEADRARIQAKINEFEVKMKAAQLKGEHALASSYSHSIMVLKGNCRPVRG